MAEIAKATDWHNHSIRGFLRANLTRKMGLTVESRKNEAGERTCRVRRTSWPRAPSRWPPEP
jgi:hypothetical protein